jgi:UDP-N-acetylglucosamine 2-epimerase (non-hydrolysing)
VAHIEAGLRSFDQKMPEEINRMVTDSISDLLLTPDEFANSNLRKEGHAEDQIKFVGNIMIDTLEAHRDRASALDLNGIVRAHAIAPEVGSQKSEGSGQISEASSDLRPPTSDLCENAFCVLTMHRPSNVDHPEVLRPLVRLLADEIAAKLPLVWSVHPRARKNLQTFGLWDEIARNPRIILIDPIGYHEMLKLNMTAKVMLTDSGGLQEESCVLGTPCITMRETTERPVTLVEHGGVSELTGPDPVKIRAAFKKFLNFDRKGHTPPLWDGKTAGRIVRALCEAAG